MRLLRYSMTILLLTAICAIAKDYQTFYSNRTALFSREYDSQSDIQCVRIDSVKFQADSVFYPYAVIQENEPSNDCQFSKLASWIGKSVTISENGMNTFVNRAGDSIRINTKAALGEKWIAYQIPDSITIEARITQFETLTFLGVIDSVKTINFQTFDKDMKPIDYEINNMKLQLSKNYGIVTMLSFYYFPNLNGNYEDYLQEYTLTGLTNPEIGVQNLTWFAANDFQVGDELHVLSNDNPGPYGAYRTEDKEIYKYLERINFQDSIVYRYILIHGSEKVWWADSSSYNYSNDTLTITIRPDSIFDKLPGEPIGHYVNDYVRYNRHHAFGESIPNKVYSELYAVRFEGTDSCLNITIDSFRSHKKYLKGLGGPYYDFEYDEVCSSVRMLVYYKKGDIEWGTKLNITSAVEAEISDQVRIYPNPAQEKVNINIPNFGVGNYFVSIYDVLGNEVKQAKIQESNSIINIENLETGIYMLRISNFSGVIKSEKLIIE